MKIGEDLSLVIYLKDPLGKYDVAARDCWAYDSPDVTDQDTTKLQLTTTEGCIKYLQNLINQNMQTESTKRNRKLNDETFSWIQET